jgi:hypothetical protein
VAASGGIKTEAPEGIMSSLQAAGMTARRTELVKVPQQIIDRLLARSEDESCSCIACSRGRTIVDVDYG